MYAVHRIEKFKGNTFGLQMETQRRAKDHFQDGRDFADSEIDWHRTDQNRILVECASWDKEFNRRAQAAGVHVKKDSVKFIGAIYTASKEFFTPDPKGGWVMDKKTADYFNECIKFHVREYCGGDPRRVTSCVVHMDETTPHLEIYSDCLFRDDQQQWHLSAKTILGGRKDFHERQNRFHDQIGKPRGMERGKVRDPEEKLKHKKTADYHAERRAAVIAAQETRQAELERSIANLEHRLSEGSQELQELEKLVADKQTQEQRIQAKLDELCRDIVDPWEQDLLRQFVNRGGHTYDGRTFRFIDYWEQFKQYQVNQFQEQYQVQLQPNNGQPNNDDQDGFDDQSQGIEIGDW